MAEPTPDLHALAAEALSTKLHPTLGAHGTVHTDSVRAWFRPTTPDEFIDAVLAAVLPAHRAMVLREALNELATEIAWQREKYADGTDRVALGRLIGMEDAATTVRRLAATTPPARQDSPGTTEQATAVPETTERRSAGCDDCGEPCAS